MERIYLGISCDTAGVDDAISAEAFLSVLKTETGKRLFRIVTQRINKKGYRMNVDNEGRTDHWLYDYFFGSKMPTEPGEKKRDWNFVLSVMEKEQLSIEGINMDVVRKIGELLV